MRVQSEAQGAAPIRRHQSAAAPPVAGTVHELLKARAGIDPTAVAVMAPGREPLTYTDLLHQAQATVRSLASIDLKRNDRVALVLPNGPEMASAFLAIACGAACAPLNPGYKDEEFDFYLSDLGARALVVGAGMDSPARAVALRRNIEIIELETASEGRAGAFTLSGTDSQYSGGDLFARTEDTALMLHTSGTTSRPKLVPLSHANVCKSGFNTATTLALDRNDRCLNVMPLFHIHGLMAAVMASITAGSALVCTPGFDPERFFFWLDEFQPTWYTAVPTIHQAVLALAEAHADVIARRPLRLIRSSSAALPAQVMQELEQVFRTQVIEAYGMTEAAHQMASNPLAPHPRKAGSVGIAAGPDVAIMNEAGVVLPRGEIGEVVIRGDNVTKGYESNPEANRCAFTDGWFRTGDQGKFDGDGYLFLTGRIKEIINRGGEKLAPREVDDVLMQHPAVAQAVTFGIPHRTLGEDVAAAIVLRAGATASEAQIRDFAAERLAAYKTPKQILIVEKIPRGATGKLQRIGLADKFAELLASKHQTDFVAAGSGREKDIAAIWSKLLRVERIGTRDDFHALGGDSLSMTAMILEVEARFGRTVPIDNFLRSPTVSCLAALLQADSSDGPQVAPDPGRAEPSKPVIRDTWLSGLKNRLFQWLALYAPGYKTTRVWLHRTRGVRIGINSSIGLSALIETAYPRLVTIGDNVTIGMRALIIAHLRDSTVQSRILDRPTVRIENNVYIGPGAIILPNVTIGEGAVVTAGSVVNRSVPPRTLVQGNPAKPVAHCGVSLGGGVSYEQFLRELRPIKQPTDD